MNDERRICRDDMFKYMREEEVDLIGLLHYILKKWRIVVIAMIVFGVVADLYYVKKSSDAVTVESQTEEDSIEILIKNAKENLTEDAIQQVDRVYTMYAYNEDSYQENAEYLDSSLLMQLNPEEIPTVLLSYQISRNISEEEIRNIMTMYELSLIHI